MERRQIVSFYRRYDVKENITGMMVYYYLSANEKLWYFCHEITMETENEDVLLGKLLDESSYKKE